MATPPPRRRLVRLLIRLGVLGGAVAGARAYRDRAVAANTLRYDHVLDRTKPFLGQAADQSGSSTPSSASR